MLGPLFLHPPQRGKPCCPLHVPLSTHLTPSLPCNVSCSWLWWGRSGRKHGIPCVSSTRFLPGPGGPPKYPPTDGEPSPVTRLRGPTAPVHSWSHGEDRAELDACAVCAGVTGSHAGRPGVWKSRRDTPGHLSDGTGVGGAWKRQTTFSHRAGLREDGPHLPAAFVSERARRVHTSLVFPECPSPAQKPAGAPAHTGSSRPLGLGCDGAPGSPPFGGAHALSQHAPWWAPVWRSPHAHTGVWGG